MMESFVLLCGLSRIAWMDWKMQKISGKMLIFLWLSKSIFLLGISISAPDEGADAIAMALTGMLLGGGMFMAIYLISGGGMGGGDVKLFAVLGYYLGYHLFISVSILTFLLAASCSVTLIILKKITVRYRLPLAPFALAAVIFIILRGKT